MGGAGGIIRLVEKKKLDDVLEGLPPLARKDYLNNSEAIKALAIKQGIVHFRNNATPKQVTTTERTLSLGMGELIRKGHIQLCSSRKNNSETNPHNWRSETTILGNKPMPKSYRRDLTKTGADAMLDLQTQLLASNEELNCSMEPKAFELNWQPPALQKKQKVRTGILKSPFFSSLNTGEIISAFRLSSFAAFSESSAPRIYFLAASTLYLV